MASCGQLPLQSHDMSWLAGGNCLCVAIAMSPCRYSVVVITRVPSFGSSFVCVALLPSARSIAPLCVRNMNHGLRHCTVVIAYRTCGSRLLTTLRPPVCVCFHPRPESVSLSPLVTCTTIPHQRRFGRPHVRTHRVARDRTCLEARGTTGYEN